jgi:membrane protein DedA with SNARE-associated domain
MLSIGFFLGRSIPNIEERIHWIILGVIVVSLIPGIIEYAKERWREQRMHRAS